MGAYLNVECMFCMHIGFWRHEPVSDQSADGLTQATMRFFETVGGDWVKLTPAGTYQATALGLVDEWAGDSLGRRNIVRRTVNCHADWPTLTAHAHRTGLGHQEWVSVESVRRLKARLPAHTPLIATVFSTLSQAIQLAGIDAVEAHARSQPLAFADLLRALGRRNQTLIQALTEAGADGIYYVSQHHQTQLWQQEMSEWLEWSFDAGAMSTSPVRSWNVVHFHGRCDGMALPPLPPGWSAHNECRESESRMATDGNTTHSIRWLTLSTETLSDIPDTSQYLRDWIVHQKHAENTHWRISAECVLPLNFDLQLAKKWVQAVHQWRCDPNQKEIS